MQVIKITHAIIGYKNFKYHKGYASHKDFAYYKGCTGYKDCVQYKSYYADHKSRTDYEN